MARGAMPAEVEPVEAFVEAAMLADRDQVAALGDEVAAKVRRIRPGLLVWAAARGRQDSVTMLVSLGFDVNAYGRHDVPVEQQWETPLHAAVNLGDAEMVALLLSLGADPSLRDVRFGATPLDWARHLGQAAAAAVLEDRSPQDDA
jgi:hypothetical protein